MNEPADRNADGVDDEAEANLPGLGGLREAVLDRTIRRLPGASTLRRDGTAGLTVAISSVPDGMASGVLAGVNPIYGLYASAVGPVVGGLLAGTTLLVITNTSATALVAGEALLGLSGEDRDAALFLLVILAGAFQILFGLLRLGQATRFVSFSVMTGFLAGIATVLILSQLSTVTGYDAAGGNRITQTYDLLVNLDRVDFASLGLAALTLAIAVAMLRTRLARFSGLAAIAVPSVLIAVIEPASVRIVDDVGDIPGGVPSPFIPSLSDFSFGVLTGALSLALVVLVQGAGVSQSVPNPDGSRRRPSRDFIAQGAANVAAGFMRGVPVGGSLGATALNVVSGAGRRWASVFAGLWMALFVIALPGVVSRVAMPALGALLILAGIRSIKPADVSQVWRAGWLARTAAAVTFLATLILPIQLAVGSGVLLSALLYVGAASTDISVFELSERSDGRLEERNPPRHLPSRRATILDVYGDLFYAGARTLERKLPLPGDGERPIVILRLRGFNEIGATLIEVLSDYADKLRQVGGRLYLTGIGTRAFERLKATGEFRLTGPVRLYEATPVLRESTRRALADAEAWLAGSEEDSTTDAEDEHAGADDDRNA